MYNDELIKIAGTAKKKISMISNSPSRYAVASFLGGLYVCFGTILSYSIGATLELAGSPSYKIAMGLSFGIALCLIVFAGADLFTSNTLYMSVGAIKKETTWLDAFKVWGFCWIGNLVGSVISAWFFVQGGLINDTTAEFMVHFTEIKANFTTSEMLIRGIFCNLLVCLASWCTYRMKNEAAKIMMILWCVFVFFTTGGEHSIANMGLFSMALMVPQGAGLAMAGIIKSLIVTTIGNVIAGAVILGMGYTYISKDN